MLNIPVPYQKFHDFQEKLSITDTELAQLRRFAALFVDRKTEFAQYLYDAFYVIPDTRIILERSERLDYLLQAWAHWFESLFTAKLDAAFAARLWRVGLRHVEVNLDQRYTNLGFSLTRQFCHAIVLASIPVEEQGVVTHTIDKLLDLCLLVETSAYIEATTRCDLEVIKGIADTIRNPVTVIGGNIKRLQKKVNAGDPLFDTYATVMSENLRLEHIVTDIKQYIETLNTDPEFHLIRIDELLADVLDRLSTEGRCDGTTLDLSLDTAHLLVKGDPRDIERLFFHLLQNSFEAVGEKGGAVQISSRMEYEPFPSVVVDIFNTGSPPKAEDLEKLFSPFFSTKATGSGFGLPIARLAARKNYGKLVFLPLPGEGVRVTVSLPVPNEYEDYPQVSSE